MRTLEELRVLELLKDGRTLSSVIGVLESLQEYGALEIARSMKEDLELLTERRAKKRSAFEQLEASLRDVKDSLYGLAGYGLLEGSKLHKLKHSITDCINEAWDNKNS
ncbi:MAG: hypothetical protein GX025_10855 [Clostridiales bacterium]|nr:hypothetical protein [Clostridiales bacterium]